VTEQLNAITTIQTQFYHDQTFNFTSRGIDVKCDAKQFKDALRDDTRKYYHKLMTSSPNEKTTNAILNASKSLKNHPRLILDSSKMPLYLKNGDVSLHTGANVITRMRTGSYVDEAWMVERDMVVRRPNHTCTQCKRTTPGGVTFRHFALECPGTIDHRLSLLQETRWSDELGNLSVEDMVWMTAKCQKAILNLHPDKKEDIRQNVKVNATLLKIFQFARQIDNIVGIDTKRQEKWITTLDERHVAMKRKREEEKALKTTKKARIEVSDDSTQAGTEYVTN